MCELIAPLFRLDQIDELVQAKVSALTFSCDFFATKQERYFSQMEFESAVNSCHALGIKAYTFVNRIFVEDELAKLDEYLKWLKKIGVDGIYYHDHAVYIIAKKYDLVPLLIFCHDTILTNSYDIKSYLDLGIKRCVISCDITLEEINEIVALNSNCELMIHGHINLADSKRELLSVYFDEINRENSTGPYTIVEETREQKMYIYEDQQGTHIFTSECLQMVKELPLLVGKVGAVNINGLFVDYQNILVAARNYARIIEGEDADEIYQNWISKEEEDKYTSGYLYKKTNLVK